MTAITYTAKRNVIGGHTAGLDYDLEPGTSTLTPSLKPNANRSYTLSGTAETVFNNIEEEWAVRTVAIDQTDYDTWREFFSSVAGGELFALDVYGSIATPDNVQSAVLVGSPTYTRIGLLEKWNISFKARVQ